jgi:hypothetical protein
MKDFEKNIRQQLDNYGSPLEEDRLWANIDQELRPGRRRRRILVWLPLLLLCFSIVGVGAWYLHRLFSENRAASSTAVLAPVPVTNSNPAGGPAETPVAERPAENTHNPAAVAANHPHTAVLAAPTAARSASGNQGAQNNKIVLQKTPGVNPGAPKGRLQPTATESGRVENNAAAAPGTVARAATTKAPETARPVDAAAPINNVLSSTDEKKPTPETIRLTIAPALLPWAGPQTLALPLRDDQPTAQVSWKKLLRDSVQPARHLYLGLYGGVLYPLKTLKARNASGQTLQNQRRSTETILEAISGGMYVGVPLKKGFSLETGFDYTRINERFYWSKTTVDTFGIKAGLGYYIDAVGNITPIVDSVPDVRATFYEKQVFNRYELVQIPLGIGYSWQHRQRFQPYVKAGAMLNVWLRHRAEMMGQEGVPVWHYAPGSGAQNPFRNRIGMSVYAQAGARLRLRNHLDVFGEVRYLQHLNSLTRSVYPVRQQYGLPGMQVGVQWNW